MSNKTFNMPTENFENAVPLLRRQLVLSPESCMSVSPDSNICTVNLREREASTSPDINKKCFFDQCPSVFNINNATLVQDELFCVVTSNMNQTFIAAPVNGSNDFWNESSSCIGNEKTESNMYQTFSRQTEDKCNGEMSPELVGKDRQLSPYEDSHRGSTENDHCSLSSGEMLMRSNSFCLEDQSLIAISSLEDSSISPAPSCLTLLAESNLLTATTLAEVCEKSKEIVTRENIGHPCLGITFTQADNMEHLTEEDDIATFNSPVDLPSENEGGLLMTFIYETPSSVTKEAKSASVESDLLPHFSEAYTPEQTQGSCIAMFAMQDNDDIQTSTPVQNIKNKMPSLPLLSPCTGNESSPGLQHLESHHISVTPKQCPVTGLSPSLSKVKKMEISKFPKTDLSNVKHKVQSRAPHQVAVAGPGPGSSSMQKVLQDNVSKQNASHRKTVKNTSAKVMSSTTVISSASKMLDDRQVNKRVMNLGGTVRQSCEHTVTGGHGKTRASTSDYRPAVNNQTVAIHFRNASSEKTLADLSQVSDSSTQHGSSQTSGSPWKTSSAGSGQMHPLPSSKKDMLHKTEVRSGSALSQERAPISKARPRCSSESLTSKPHKEKIMTVRVTTSFNVPKAVTEQSASKPVNLNCFSQNKQLEETKSPTDSSPREFKKISLVSSKSTTAGAQSDKSKNISQGQPSARRERGTSLTQPPPSTPRPNPLSSKQRQGTQRGLEFRTSRVQLIQQKNNAGSQRTQGTEEPSFGSKSQPKGSRPPQTTKRPSVVMGPPLTTAYRLPRKTMGLSKGLNEHTMSNEQGQGAHQSTPASGGTTHKPTPIKSIAMKTRLTSTPGKSNGQTLTTSSKFAPSTNTGASDSTVSPLKTNAFKRFHQPTLTGPVDRSKPKASPRLQQSSQPNQSVGTRNGVQASKDEREDQNNQQLKQLLLDSDCRFQALAVVLQHTLAERDEATRQCRELSQELVNLREELVSSIHSSELLEKEKDEMRTVLEDALQKMQEQHQKDLAELEQRLQALYQGEWNSVHLTYQEEADKCKTLMQHQIEELKANHEARKQELEHSHSEQLRCIKQQYEISFEELRNVHNQELVSLDKSLKDAEAALSEQIQKLEAENSVLMEKLATEEKRRKELAENSQKDSQTLYLEQELESLKVVLDLKNEQLHQQEKKLMDINKLTEKNVKLDESLKKVQQENEDLKARMERHAALSRQLSSEQAMLQESLQKESKVNKRLSMENEELLWKLHNGDLSSPRRVSPSSTSPSFSLQSPSTSGLFSSPPLSPR